MRRRWSPKKWCAINITPRVLDHIKVYEEGMLVVVFQDGTEIEYRVE